MAVKPKLGKKLIRKLVVIPTYTSNDIRFCYQDLPYELQPSFRVLTYRKIPNISRGLIEVRKHFLGGLNPGAYIRGAFGGHFVLVSEYQDLKNHCYISLI